MNTLIEKNTNVLTEKIISTINHIEKEVEKRNYQIVSENANFELYKKLNWTDYLQNVKYNQIKKLNKSIRKVNDKNSLRSFNLFFNHLHNRILSKRNAFTPEWAKQWYPDYIQVNFEKPEFDKIHFTKSPKELLIQDKRKKWKEAQKIAEQLLSEYKEEKGDFYKTNS